MTVQLLHERGDGVYTASLDELRETARNETPPCTISDASQSAVFPRSTPAVRSLVRDVDSVRAAVGEPESADVPGQSEMPEARPGQAFRVTKVSIRPTLADKVCATASIVIDDMFVIHDLRVVKGDKGLFVAMPSRKLPNGDSRDVCHPISTEARNRIREAVLGEFEAVGGLASFSCSVDLDACPSDSPVELDVHPLRHGKQQSR